ncbi:MAG: hypothetical protein ACLGG8_05355, partial [Gammaproteobacteria bacterium]
MKHSPPERRSPWPVAAGGLLCACLIMAAAPVLAQDAMVQPEPVQVVHLNASAVREVPQDWLTIQLRVTREGTDAGQVQAQIR